MATHKEVKKLWKNTKQGLLGFSLCKACGVVLTAVFLVSTFHYPLTKVVILLQPNPLLLYNASSSSCTSASDIDIKVAPLSPSPTPTNVRKPPRQEIDGGLKGGQRSGDDISSCDLFDGKWVEDDESPLYEPGSCPFVEEAFNCFKNGRADLNYTRLRWQPKACSLPRLEGKKLLEMLRGKRLAFVGDSLNRNMWESLACILRSSLKNKDGAYEITGRKEFKHANAYAYKFSEYNCTIEFFRSPFLVQEWEAVSSNGTRKESLRLDVMDRGSSIYKTADVIVFNTGHWWTHEKTSKGEDFYQEGDHVHRKLSASDAYHKALVTWTRWLKQHVELNRTVVFFRGYSWSHFSGGKWDSGGGCDGEKLPIVDDKHLARYPKLVRVLEAVVSGMTTSVHYLNITRMTDYRKEAHPSVYRFPAGKQRREMAQDCSHWCLPGVPDAWNELMYALLRKRWGM